MDHVYWKSPWKDGIASSILLVGSSGVTKLEPNQVYVHVEYLYASMVSPMVLVCLGVKSMNDALVCLRNMSISIMILVGMRVPAKQLVEVVGMTSMVGIEGRTGRAFQGA